MPRVLRDDDRIVDAEELDLERVKSLTDSTRREILEILAEEESYPLEVSRELGIDKQKAYYHFKKLENSGLVEKVKSRKVSGGSATYYRTSAPAFVYDLGYGGDEIFIPEAGPGIKSFLGDVLGEELDYRIVVGSPEEHGPDQVSARDGHLAGEVAAKLGSYGKSSGKSVFLDTEIFRRDDFSGNLFLVGGVLTNTVTKKFNEEFPASFEGESFPYREIRTPESSYSEENIGVMAKTENPEDSDSSIFMVAGVRNQGTRAAVVAFKNLEDIVEDYEEGEFYRVVRGLDLDGDGEVDDFEVVE
jgi:DNA-binding transcriptional ArsR family regulator